MVLLPRSPEAPVSIAYGSVAARAARRGHRVGREARGVCVCGVPGAPRDSVLRGPAREAPVAVEVSGPLAPGPEVLAAVRSPSRLRAEVTPRGSMCTSCFLCWMLESPLPSGRFPSSFLHADSGLAFQRCGYFFLCSFLLSRCRCPAHPSSPVLGVPPQLCHRLGPLCCFSRRDRAAPRLPLVPASVANRPPSRSASDIT